MQLVAGSQLAEEPPAAIASLRLDALLRLETFTSFEDARVIAQEWDALIARIEGSLYMTFSWCQVWWRHYGAGRELRLMTVRANGELVGVLPFFIDRLRLALGWARVAKVVGSDSTLTIVDLPVSLGVAPEAFSLAIDRLLVVDRVDMAHVGPCSAATGRLDALRKSAAEIGNDAEMVRDRQSGSHMVFEMPEGFDAYLRGLSKNHRSNYRRNLNKLNRTFKFDVDVVRDVATLEREFETFVQMHQAQWNAAGKLGHFDDWPMSREFSRDLVRALARADHVRLIRLLADDEVVAYYWCLCMDGTYYWRLPARVTGAEWNRFALGRVGLMKMMEAAAAEGATAIEAGTGRYDYKDQLNASTLPLYSIALCRRGFVPRLRARLTIAYGDLLNLAYYRLWYLRVAPRLRVLRGPLWQSWIRRRF
jgi:CelD/BcsL family acetyltransferase involved in cellulose biosynthesis